MSSALTRGRETAERRVGHVAHLLGDLVGGLLAEPDVTDVILNPDGKLWVTRLERDSECVGTMTAPQAEALIAAIASTLHLVATRESPIVEGELLIDGSRFEGVVPPIVPAPAFAIRRKASAVFPLARYVERGQMTERQRELIEAAIIARKNILAVGGTGRRQDDAAQRRYRSDRPPGPAAPHHRYRGHGRVAVRGRERRVHAHGRER